MPIKKEQGTTSTYAGITASVMCGKVLLTVCMGVCLAGCVLCQAALKAFDDDHNGALDEPEFERFAKSLMKSGKGQEGGGEGAGCHQETIGAESPSPPQVTW